MWLFYFIIGFLVGAIVTLGTIYDIFNERYKKFVDNSIQEIREQLNINIKKQ
jgi:hypothetical protein